MYENVIQKTDTLNTYVSKVFAWMFLGLIVTAVTAYGLAATGLYVFVLLNPIILLAAFIGEFALVIFITRKIAKNAISPNGARIAFIIYAIVNGLTFSAIFLAYNIGLIYQAFLVTAITFGVMAFYGHTTSRDLTGFGTFLIMALVGIIVATLVNMVLGFFGFFSTTLDLFLSYAAVLIFLGLTAFDVQKIKAYYYGANGDETLSNNFAIMAALSLYLDFINLFLYILKIFGRRN